MVIFAAMLIQSSVNIGSCLFSRHAYFRTNAYFRESTVFDIVFPWRLQNVKKIQLWSNRKFGFEIHKIRIFNALCTSLLFWLCLKSLENNLSDISIRNFQDGRKSYANFPRKVEGFNRFF